MRGIPYFKDHPESEGCFLQLYNPKKKNLKYFKIISGNSSKIIRLYPEVATMSDSKIFLKCPKLVENSRTSLMSYNRFFFKKKRKKEGKKADS